MFRLSNPSQFFPNWKVLLLPRLKPLAHTYCDTSTMAEERYDLSAHWNMQQVSRDCKPRAVVGIRVRRIVIRIHVHDAVVRIRVVAGAKNTTPTGVLYLLKADAKVHIFP